MMNCTQAIEHYKKEIMDLLGMKEWGVLNLVTVDDETIAKVHNIMGKIDALQYAKYELDRMRSEIMKGVEWK
jgi:hypothetical protein